MLSRKLEYLCTEMECFRQGCNTFVQSWNAFDSVGMRSTELEYLGTGLERILEVWKSFDRVGIPLYRVGMRPTMLECHRKSWNTVVQGFNAF
jgi:hypothetical protein